MLSASNGPCVSLVTGAPLARHKRMSGPSSPNKPSPQRGQFSFSASGDFAFGSLRADDSDYLPSESDWASPKPVICIEDLDNGSEHSDGYDSQQETPSPQRTSLYAGGGGFQSFGTERCAASDAGKRMDQDLWGSSRKASKSTPINAPARRGTGSTVVSEAARSSDPRDEFGGGHDYASSGEEDDDDLDLGQPLPAFSEYTAGEPGEAF